jgi:DNA-binding beta-propeller fold protein YncE
MKTIRLVLAAALFALVPHAVPAAVVSFAAPAGYQPAGHLRGSTFDAVLPSGRIVSPIGQSVVTGMNALGVALTPDGRFAIVTNDDEREQNVRSLTDPNTYGGYSLAVVDTTTMTVVDRYRAPNERYWVGLLALADPQRPGRTLVLASGGPANAVYALTLDAAGHLTPDQHHVIAIPGPVDPGFADKGHSFPGTLVASPDGRRAYVVDEGGMAVSTIDLATRALLGAPQSVGYFPFGAAVAGNQVLITNEGLMRYALAAQPTPAPPFHTPVADLQRASSLSLASIATSGVLAPPASIAMDPAPDGLRAVGGAHPSAVAATPDGSYAYVAMTNVDRIATVQLTGTPHVVGGTELRLFDRGPYGTQPAGLALSHDGSRLYVALAGLNAVAVIDARDPVHLHRLGLIPTGWYPTALALSSDGRSLYVANTKGFGHEAGFSGDPATLGDANAVWSTLQKIDLSTIRLSAATMATLRNTRRVVTKPPVYPAGITNVVTVLEEDKTFDAVFGDLDASWGDPSLVSFGRSVTPNLHALAQRYGLAVNFYADAEEADAGHQFATSGTATLYAERTLLAKDGRASLAGASQDPEDYPRLGSIFNALQRHQVSYRDYGELVRLAGYDDGHAPDPKAADPPAGGLGGLYAADVPAPAALDGHVDLNYPGWNARIGDEQRAREFVRDYSALVASRRQPRYTAISLPGQMAEGDRALGEIVDYLSHLPSWRHTAIFVMPADAQSARDHIDLYRSYALVISPYAKRHYVGSSHLSTVSVLKTSEQLLHVGTLGLGDLLATDMSDFFTTRPDARPYVALSAPPSR